MEALPSPLRRTAAAPRPWLTVWPVVLSALVVVGLCRLLVLAAVVALWRLGFWRGLGFEKNASSRLRNVRNEIPIRTNLALCNDKIAEKRKMLSR